MQFHTIITSKGTTTIPSRIRRELNLKPGSMVEFTKDEKTGKYVIDRLPTLEEIQQRNQKYIAGRKPLTNKQMDKIVQKAIVEEYTQKHAKNT